MQFRVVGPEPQTIKAIAEELKATMRQDTRLLGVNDNWNEQIAVVRIDVDPARAQQFRVSAQSVAQLLRLAYICN